MKSQLSARAAWETGVARRWSRLLPLALCAFLGAPSFSAAAGTGELTAFRGVKSAPDPFHHVRHGMPRFDVLVLAGAPDHKLAPDVWIYWNVKSNHPDDTRRGFDAMVIRFTGDKLTEMRLVQSTALKALIAAQAATAARAKASPPLAQR